MRVLCYDCFSGISGDMNLGAMLDLGIEEPYLNSELDKLNLGGWKLKVEKAQRHGIQGTKVTVIQTVHEHAHRHLSDIEKIINGSSLTDEVKLLSMKIFRKIAVAEAKVHGIPVEEVHFHEVGAIDSIVDITGAAICFAALKPDAVFVSEIELGSGFVKCDHGNLPVPAPATAEIVKGIPVKTGGVGFEATTPTGAAILSALGTDFGSTQAVKIIKTGYGVGHKDHPDIPNLLRVSLGETVSKSATGHKALLIESNIDDMNPEFYDHISERLFKAGASDVYFSQIIMKKGRPGVVLKVVCETGLEDIVKDIIFKESTTLGIRIFEFRKETLAREFAKLSTRYGEITIKKSFYENVPVSVKPEYEDCKRIAFETGVPVKEVYNHVIGLLSLKNDQI
ncbi:MAG: nickel pincer cofactor biosynthesis protein LarC [Bacteroidales bacterium]|nr:nickel pincer cofactor biosynthesis protein LarC [Bacteroidales bacterium]